MEFSVLRSEFKSDVKHGCLRSELESDVRLGRLRPELESDAADAVRCGPVRSGAVRREAGRCSSCAGCGRELHTHAIQPSYIRHRFSALVASDIM
ncbi:unnamed protein product [Euphydryas editha]|uniref:Uncharacterized protein n=1 Tax=Euphydryas editha TaxID=104508 RepID=A0AAU9TVH5_EUPED|nr:unnamed protein product [Euphydryas editha]